MTRISTTGRPAGAVVAQLDGETARCAGQPRRPRLVESARRDGDDPRDRRVGTGGDGAEEPDVV